MAKKAMLTIQVTGQELCDFVEQIPRDWYFEDLPDWYDELYPERLDGKADPKKLAHTFAVPADGYEMAWQGRGKQTTEFVVFDELTKWKTEKTTTTFVVVFEVPNEHANEVRASIEKLGGKIQA